MKSFIKFAFVFYIIISFSCSSIKEAITKNRNGSSFKKAIIVNNISEEYEYARKQCDDCKFLGQSLSFKDETPYDILSFEKPNGKEVFYYFDISSFYGKRF